MYSPISVWHPIPTELMQNSKTSRPRATFRGFGGVRSRPRQKAVVRRPQTTLSSIGSLAYAQRQLSLNSPQKGEGTVAHYRLLPGSTEGGIRLIGRDLCAVPVTVTSTTGTMTVTTISLTVDSNATATVARWGTYGSMFDLVKIRSLSVSFVSSQPTTVGGQNFLGISRTQGGLQAPTTAAEIMRYLHSAMGPAYSNLQTRTDGSFNAINWYSTESQGSTGTDHMGDIIFGSQGYTIATIPGTLLVDYDIEFAQPSAI